MLYNPFVAQRKAMKLELINMIKDKGEVEKEKIIALFSLKTGLKRATILEYWEELEQAGLIEKKA